MAFVKHSAEDSASPMHSKRHNTETLPTTFTQSSSTSSKFEPLGYLNGDTATASVVGDLDEDQIDQQHSLDIATSLRQQLFEQWPIELPKDLHSRLVPSISSVASGSLETTFDTFKRRELTISGRPSKEFVRPSGSLAASVILKLHYPTFTTTTPIDGQVYDLSSPCPSLLARAGYSDKNSLWIEAGWRRETAPSERSCPLNDYTPELRNIHDEFTTWCETNSFATVELIFGARNRKDLIARHKNLIHWTLHVGDSAVKLSIAPPTSGSLVRLLVYTYHPEYLYRVNDIGVAKDFDLAMDLAAAIGEVKGYKYGYFERRAKYQLVMGINAREQGDNALHDAISLHKTGAVTTFGQLPQSIINWLREKAGITTKEDFTARCKDQATTAFIHSLFVSKGGIAKRDKERLMGLETPSGLAQIRDHNRTKQSLLKSNVTRDGPRSVVRIICAKCRNPKSERDDKLPDWQIGTLKYVVRKNTSCPTPGCADSFMTKGRRSIKRKRETYFVPVDPSLAFIHAQNLSKVLASPMAE